MICLAAKILYKEDLDDLTEDQLADIDRLLMVLWKTRPAIYSGNSNILRDRLHTDEPEGSPDLYFLRVSGL